MFFLITGASGAGKSTVRRFVAPKLAPEIECVELRHVVNVPALPTIAWRQKATEAAVMRALELQVDGRHLLLSGDPVAAGEVLAAPSADALEGIAVCLLDLSAEAQAARLANRGDDPTLLVHHHAFADWMRAHARDPGHMPHVLSTNGWQEMRWERWTRPGPCQDTWGMRVLDTSTLSETEVAKRITTWCRHALAGGAPVMHIAGSEPFRP